MIADLFKASQDHTATARYRAAAPRPDMGQPDPATEAYYAALDDGFKGTFAQWLGAISQPDPRPWATVDTPVATDPLADVDADQLPF